MKKLMIVGLVFMSSAFAQSRGDLDIFKRVIKDEVHDSTVALNRETVRCSALGYGAAELKISVPSLKWNAVLDHSNNDGLGPCMTAGRMSCNDMNDWGKFHIPEVLLNEDKPTEVVQVRVKLEEEFTIAGIDSCHRRLSEFIETDVRGIKFTHLRTKSIGSLPVEECLAIKEKTLL